MNKKLTSAFILACLVASLIPFSFVVVQVKASDPATVTTSTTVNAISQGYQRTIIFSENRIWIGLSDGDSQHLVSSLDGQTWTSPDSNNLIANEDGDDQGENLAITSNGTYVFVTTFYYPYYWRFRRGYLNDTSGYPEWTSSLVTARSGSIPVYDIAVDNNGYPFIVGAYNEAWNGITVSKSSTNTGSWSTQSGFPYNINTTGTGMKSALFGFSSDGKMYVIYCATGNQMYGRLWTGSAWETQQTITLENILDKDAFQGFIDDSNNIHLVYLNQSTSSICHLIRYASNSSWGTKNTVEYDVASTCKPQISEIDEGAICFWSSSNVTYYKKFDATSETWDEEKTSFWTGETMKYDDLMTIPEKQTTNDYMGVILLNGLSSPYLIRYKNMTLGALIPTCESYGTNNTWGAVGSNVLFHSYWSASQGNLLSGGYFSHNTTGEWMNETYRDLGGDSVNDWFNTTLNLEGEQGTLGFRWYLNDSSGEWGIGDIHTIAKIDYSLPTLSYSKSANITGSSNESVTEYNITLSAFWGEYDLNLTNYDVQDMKPALLNGKRYMVKHTAYGTLQMWSCTKDWQLDTLLDTTTQSCADTYVYTFPTIFPDLIVVIGSKDTGSQSFIRSFNITSDTWQDYSYTTNAHYLVTLDYDPATNLFVSGGVLGAWANSIETVSPEELFDLSKWTEHELTGDTVVGELMVTCYDNRVFYQEGQGSGSPRLRVCEFNMTDYSWSTIWSVEENAIRPYITSNATHLFWSYGDELDNEYNCSFFYSTDGETYTNFLNYTSKTIESEYDDHERHANIRPLSSGQILTNDIHDAHPDDGAIYIWDWTESGLVLTSNMSEGIESHFSENVVVEDGDYLIVGGESGGWSSSDLHVMCKKDRVSVVHLNGKTQLDFDDIVLTVDNSTYRPYNISGVVEGESCEMMFYVNELPTYPENITVYLQYSNATMEKLARELTEGSEANPPLFTSWGIESEVGEEEEEEEENQSPFIVSFSTSSTIQEDDYEYLNITINDPDGVAELKSLTLTLSGSIIGTWNNITNTFSLMGSYATLNSTNSVVEAVNSTAYKVCFNVAFSEGYGAGLKNGEATVYDLSEAVGTETHNNWFTFELLTEEEEDEDEGGTLPIDDDEGGEIDNPVFDPIQDIKNVVGSLSDVLITPIVELLPFPPEISRVGIIIISLTFIGAGLIKLLLARRGLILPIVWEEERKKKKKKGRRKRNVH